MRSKTALSETRTAAMEPWEPAGELVGA
jgi:hypothetical protein